VRDRLDLQFQDTYYRIVLQAHNELGYSSESSIIIKTKKDRVGGGTGVSKPNIDSTSSVDKLCTKLEHFLFVTILILAS